MKTCNRYQKDEIEFIKKNVEQYGISVCAEKLGRTKSAIKGKVKRMFGRTDFKCSATQEEIEKLEFKKQFKEFTLDFSECEYPKELAYFLGCFWSDGTVQPGHGYAIEILKDDADNIRDIFNKVATFYESNRIRDGRREQVTFRLNTHKDITDLFVFLGKYSSSTEGFEKIINYIPIEYRNYFIRGYFDGDGCLYISHNKTLVVQISFAGRYEQDWKYMVHYLGTLGLPCKISRRETKIQKSSAIICSNPFQIKEFLSNIYGENDGIYLHRKYEKVDFILNTDLLNIKKRNNIIKEYKVVDLKNGDRIWLEETDRFCVGDLVMNLYGENCVIKEKFYNKNLKQEVYIMGNNKKYESCELIGKIIEKRDSLSDNNEKSF